MKTLSENKTFVQHIKQRQEDFKVHFHSQSRKPFNFLPRKIPLSSNRIISIHSPLPTNVENKRPTREKPKSKVLHPFQIGENSCSPTLFRTPQISLHYEYNKKGAHQRQPSNNRSRNENISTVKERREHNTDSVTRDYSKVLEEVMKKYRQLKTELLTKDKEVQKTQFYKEEWLKEKKRNELLQERNKNLKMKLLKIIELVQKDQLQTNDESEGIIASLQTENKYLRQMLHLYDVTDVSEQLEQLESEQDHEVDQIDNILNVFLGDLRTIQKNRKEKKDNQQLGQFNSLSLTVLNKESSFVDLSEDKLLMEQQ
ncbi:unnamed protein product (macronuclear) [Paramecium tetraurelia]|uniref:Uncharacterized protein n=1 Tax=Paramecium tetraurelia TaxID=5888 RepID=A0DJE8_PARTE|nr:uncharacterized protein GSPATT00017509001 [Paramecium tetraurelia]CAK83165.1 unnamed protein product [Paramecium tetraurelia]|eukprot:XP_001450562.1 hypothetical protein (macronuclear) [Paramecium tetraurelia strain d4-2]